MTGFEDDPSETSHGAEGGEGHDRPEIVKRTGQRIQSVRLFFLQVN